MPPSVWLLGYRESWKVAARSPPVVTAGDQASSYPVRCILTENGAVHAVFLRDVKARRNQDGNALLRKWSR
jgi:hypothetical protein